MRRLVMVFFLAACGTHQPPPAAPAAAPAPAPAAAEPPAGRAPEPKRVVTYDRDCHELCMSDGGEDISCQAECAYSVPADSDFGACMTECTATDTEASCDEKCR